jgi:hypothetical protein
MNKEVEMTLNAIMGLALKLGVSAEDMHAILFDDKVRDEVTEYVKDVNVIVEKNKAPKVEPEYSKK